MLIAQISDIHAAPGNDNIARLHRVTTWLANLRPDIIIVTGDITDQDAEDGYQRVEEALKSVRAPFLLLPGNSDDVASMRRWLTGNGQAVMPDALHFSVSLPGVSLIGIDTTVQGEAYGDIHPHLAWLERELRMLSQPTLIFMHHPLFPSGIPSVDVSMCRGGDAFRHLLTQSAVKPLAVCCGHVHRAMSTIIDGIPHVVCGSVCQPNPLLLDSSRSPPANDGPALMIHDLRSGRVMSSFVCV